MPIPIREDQIDNVIDALRTYQSATDQLAAPGGLSAAEMEVVRAFRLQTARTQLENVGIEITKPLAGFAGADHPAPSTREETAA